jgi:hypothetical protein
MEGFQQSQRICREGFNDLFRLFDGTANNLGLRNLPDRGKTFQAAGRGFIQGEGCAVRHCLHTITTYHTFSNLQVAVSYHA